MAEHPAFYLSTPNERASFALLEEIGVHLSLIDSQTMENLEKILSSEFSHQVDYSVQEECKFDCDVAFALRDGILDVRDSANCWIRIPVQVCSYSI